MAVERLLEAKDLSGIPADLLPLPVPIRAGAAVLASCRKLRTTAPVRVVSGEGQGNGDQAR